MVTKWEVIVPFPPSLRLVVTWEEEGYHHITLLIFTESDMACAWLDINNIRQYIRIKTNLELAYSLITPVVQHPHHALMLSTYEMSVVADRESRIAPAVRDLVLNQQPHMHAYIYNRCFNTHLTYSKNWVELTTKQ